MTKQQVPPTPAEAHAVMHDVAAALPDNAFGQVLTNNQQSLAFSLLSMTGMVNPTKSHQILTIALLKQGEQFGQSVEDVLNYLNSVADDVNAFDDRLDRRIDEIEEMAAAYEQPNPTSQEAAYA